MSSEVAQQIEVLLNADSSAAQRKSALKYFSEVLEEDYILNLPPQRPILKALDAVSRLSGAEPAIKSKAKKLIKEYGI